MHKSSTLRLATRRSPLARWQAEWVARELTALGQQVDLVLLTSRGDVDQAPIDGTRGVGFFTKRIQDALLQGEADIAVHSLKDLPTDPQPALQLAAIPRRAPVGDCLMTRSGETLAQLAAGAVVGTGSRRRGAQLLHIRPDLRVQAIRGNVETRLAKLQEGKYDAIVLAEAGLTRLEMTEHVSERLPLEVMLPAPGQGALGIETRADDERAISILASLDDAESRAAVTAERSLLRELSGGCLAPIAALGTVDGNRLSLRAAVLSADGQQRLDHQATGRVDQAASLGVEVAAVLHEQGADALIAAAR
ncbi:MAG: hydroxymethylbilane synthase [Pirellulaceae bacterium]